MPDASTASTALDALFDVAPAAAAAIAEDRLARSLAADCVPKELVTLLANRDQDPFRAIARRLSDLECDRSRLRPRDPLLETRPRGISDPSADKATTQAKSASERMTGDCKKAFDELFGLGAAPDEAAAPSVVER